METWIAKTIRQLAQRQLITCLILLAAGVGLAASNWRYCVNFARGPFNVSAAELGTIQNLETANRFFLRVAGSKVVDTGLQEIMVETENGIEKSRSVTSTYYAMLLGDRFLIVKSPSQPPLTVAGELVPISQDTSSRLFKDHTPQETQAHFYPYELDTEGFREPGYWALGGASLLLLVLFFVARPALARFQDPEKHPLMEKIRKWGDPMTISSELEREIENPLPKKYGSSILSEKYLIQRSFYTLDVARFEDLIWAYKKIVKKRVNFIPTGKDYHAVMIFYGASKEVQAKEKQVEEILQFAAQRAPWAVIGYSDKLAEIYKKQQAEFCGAVEARRRDLKQQPSA